ncbi:MAG: bile acid:sodium symporter family protein [Sphingobacteriales bacterium]|nr:bile acid:sodium symporter family protein [Sphingobacteriales bacterium]OJV99486.1 MAG: bile acid:sodium symporter [Sphingobacteriales bacterium 44-61]
MRLYKTFYFLAALCVLAALVLLITGNKELAAPAIILFFITLSIAFQGSRSLKGFSYTMVVLASVSAALFYPALFRKWGNFDLAVLIVPLIQLIMFGMGTSMSFRDFIGVVKSPKGVIIGVVSHFLIMPLLGFLLAYLSGLPPEIAAGIVLIGCSPNGMASNVIAYLARANVALSVTITAISTSLAPFLTPLLMKLLAGQFIEIDAWHMMMEIMKMVIAPIAAGLLFNHFFTGKFKWLDKTMPYVSMFGVAFSIVVIAAAGRDNLLSIGPVLLLIVLVHNLTGYLLGYWSARLFKMNEKDCRTVAIEVGMQNGGLATGIAKSLGKLATLGLAPAVFGPLMNVTGSILASWWHKKTPKDEIES